MVAAAAPNSSSIGGAGTSVPLEVLVLVLVLELGSPPVLVEVDELVEPEELVEPDELTLPEVELLVDDETLPEVDDELLVEDDTLPEVEDDEETLPELDEETLPDEEVEELLPELEVTLPELELTLPEVDVLDTPPVEVETPPVEVETPPVEVETPPVEVVELELIPPVVVVLVSPPVDEDEDVDPPEVELDPPELELDVEPVLVEVTTMLPPDPPPLLPPKKPPKKPPPYPMPPLPPTITVWPPLPPSGIGCGGSCGSIGTIASCGAAVQQLVVRVTTRRILRTSRELLTSRLALCRLSLCEVVAACRACLTYCTCAAGASATCTAPPPSTAPPVANAASFTSAIRTDIALAFFILLQRARSAISHRPHTPVSAKGQRLVKPTIGLTLFLRSQTGICAICVQAQRHLSQLGTERAASTNGAKSKNLDCVRFARIEQPGLPARRRGQAEMLPTAIIEAAPARGARDQPELDQVRLNHFLDRVARFRQTSGERFDPHWAALVDVRDHCEIAPVHRIEPERVNLEPGQRIIGQRAADRRIARDMREIAHPPQQPPGNPRRAARAPRNLTRAVGRDAHAEQPGGAGDDFFELGHRIEIEPDRDAKTVAQRRGQQPGPGGRADQRKGR